MIVISFPLQHDVTIKRTTFWQRKMCRGWFLASGVPDLEKSHCELVARNIDLHRPPLFLLAKLLCPVTRSINFKVLDDDIEKSLIRRDFFIIEYLLRSETIVVLDHFKIIILNVYLQSFFRSIFFSTS